MKNQFLFTESVATSSGSSVPPMPGSPVFWASGSQALTEFGAGNFLTGLTNKGSGANFTIPGNDTGGTVIGGPKVFADAVNGDYLLFGVGLGSGDNSTALITAGDYLNTGDFSIFADIELTAAPGSYAAILLSNASTGDTFRLCTKLGGSNWGTYSGGDNAASSALTNGNRYRVAMVGNTSTGGTFYLNGVASGTFTGSQGGATATPRGIGIGAELNFSSGYQRFFEGKLYKTFGFNLALSGSNLAAAHTYNAYNGS